MTCPSLHRHLRIEHVVPTTLYSVDTPRVDHSEPLPGPAEEELGVDKLWARVSSPSLGKAIMTTGMPLRSPSHHRSRETAHLTFKPVPCPCIDKPFSSLRTTCPSQKEGSRLLFESCTSQPTYGVDRNSPGYASSGRIEVSCDMMNGDADAEKWNQQEHADG